MGRRTASAGIAAVAVVAAAWRLWRRRLVPGVDDVDELAYEGQVEATLTPHGLDVVLVGAGVAHRMGPTGVATRPLPPRLTLHLPDPGDAADVFAAWALDGVPVRLEAALAGPQLAVKRMQVTDGDVRVALSGTR